MRISMVAVAAVTAMASVAHADPKSFDDLMRPSDMVQPLDMRPKTDHRVDMLATATEHRHDRLWQAIDVTTLVVSNGMLVADAAYTLSVARQGWPDGRREVGIPAAPIIGSTPSVGAVTAYFAGAIAVNTAAWWLLPPRWRSILPGLIIGAQTDALLYNYGVCRSC